MMDTVKKLALLGCSLCVMLLAGEVLIRYLIPAWPFVVYPRTVYTDLNGLSCKAFKVATSR